jgi:phytol kinase
MNQQLLWLLFFLGLLLILIIVSEVLHKYLKWTTEQSRKFLHFSGGIMCLLFPRIFVSHWWVLALAIVAFALLFVTYKRKMLPSVHKTQRYTLGSVLFPIPVYACFLLAKIKNNDLFFYLPVSLLAISDTAAEIGGNRWGHLTKQFFGGQKTLAGSVCFFITALMVNAGWLYFGFHLPVSEVIKTGLLITVFATVAELVILHGWDNISVPAVTACVLCFFIQ